MARVFGFLEIGLGIAVAYFAWLAIDGAARNASYSAFLVACLWLVEWLRRRAISQASRGARSEALTDAPTSASALDSAWSVTSPPESRFRLATETVSSIPLGVQTFSFEYGRTGHAWPLNLEGTVVRAEIQFTCRVENPNKAMFAANEYALNVLQPRFLSEARGILESVSLPELRRRRSEIARRIMEHLSPIFIELGVRLESVSIGSIDEVLREDGG